MNKYIFFYQLQKLQYFINTFQPDCVKELSFKWSRMKEELELQQIDFSKGQAYDEADFGNDLRKLVKNTSIHPYNGIGKIIAKFYDSKTKQYLEPTGTAFIVAKNLILTAAHVLKYKKYKALADDIEFFPEQLLRGEQLPSKGIKVEKIYIRNDFINLDDQQIKNIDFVFLKLEENNIINQNQILPLDFNYQFKKQDYFNISGYGVSVQKNKQYNEQSVAVAQKEDFLFYKHTTKGGNSGGPVLLKKADNKYVVVGIHKGTISQFNYCLLLKALNSPKANNFDLDFRSSLNAQDLQQNWPETYVRSFKQKGKTFFELQKIIQDLREKLKNAQNEIIQKDATQKKTKSQKESLEAMLKKVKKDLNQKDNTFQKLRKQKEGLETELKQLRKDLNQNLDKKLIKDDEQLKKKQDRIQKLIQQTLDLRTQRTKYKNRNFKLEQDIKNLKHKINKLQCNIKQNPKKNEIKQIQQVKQVEQIMQIQLSKPLTPKSGYNYSQQAKKVNLSLTKNGFKYQQHIKSLKSLSPMKKYNYSQQAKKELKPLNPKTGYNYSQQAKQFNPSAPKTGSNYSPQIKAFKSLSPLKKLNNSQQFNQVKPSTPKMGLNYSYGVSPQKKAILPSVLNERQLQLLRKWLVKPVQKIQLKFKASSYNFSIAKFYEICGELKNTIIIAKTTKGKILGGYTPLSFNPPGNKWTYQYDIQGIKDESNSSFLFSLSTNQKFQLLNNNDAIKRYKIKSCILFNDTFKIGHEANSWRNNFFDLDKFFYNTSKCPSGKQGYLKITGQQFERFSTVQWEVYQVFFK